MLFSKIVNLHTINRGTIPHLILNINYLLYRTFFIYFIVNIIATTSQLLMRLNKNVYLSIQSFIILLIVTENFIQN